MPTSSPRPSRIIRTGVILIEGNHPPGDPASAYGPRFIAELAKAQQAKIILLPDLLAKPPDRYVPWLASCDLLVGFHDTGIRWAARHYGSQAFRYAPSIPVVYEGPVHTDAFRKRPYDLGYVGSDKAFRLEFLRRIMRNASGRYDVLNHSKKRSETDLIGTREVLDAMARCRYAFITRAAIFERFPTGNRFFDQVSTGRFAGRIAEALALGCIPIYWEPRLPESGLMRRVFEAKGFKFLKHLRDLVQRSPGNRDAWPFDVAVPELSHAVVTVRTPDEAIRALSADDAEVERRLTAGRELHRRLASPDAFFDLLETWIADAGPARLRSVPVE